MLHRREKAQSTKAQSTVEYAIIIAVVISALLAMQFWMRRGVMGKLRDSTDQIGDQFSPNLATHDLTKTYNSTRSDDGHADGSMGTTITTDQQSEIGTRTETGTFEEEGSLFNPAPAP